VYIVWFAFPESTREQTGAFFIVRHRLTTGQVRLILFMTLAVRALFIV
jgi:hypothetical protein